ncbi:MAG: DUF4190 domain-containing protein [Caulobacterales bacterium]|nr:DUF4190 domain-containing protein [Caulobacterales bacterium]
MTTPDPLPPTTDATPANGLAIGSLVLGILSIVNTIIPVSNLITWVVALIGLVLGFMARKKPGGQGLAIAGIVTSAIGLLEFILLVVGMVALMAGHY